MENNKGNGRYYRLIYAELSEVTKIPNITVQEWLLTFLKAKYPQQFRNVEFCNLEFQASLGNALADLFGDGCELEQL
jgi:hypothetical protein